MKKRLFTALTMAFVAVTAFSLGNYKAIKAETEDFTDGSELINLSEIVDWNTDGEELSLMLSDDTEVYAYRSSDEYGVFKAYIPCKDVNSWKVTDKGLTIITEDGNSYYFEK